MIERLSYSDKARKQLHKMDATTRTIILSWLDKNIDGCGKPRVRGKGLTANRSGKWCYRIRDYRVLCDI
jgi:mRNA interferase RelE/StbE